MQVRLVIKKKTKLIDKHKKSIDELVQDRKWPAGGIAELQGVIERHLKNMNRLKFGQVRELLISALYACIFVSYIVSADCP